MRHLVWFSAGAASAVATKLVLGEGHDDLVVAYIDPGSEHPDNERFLTDCEEWFDHPVERLCSEKYQDTWQVWEERRYLVGPDGALCTAELKKMPRYAFERSDDIQVFGYTAEEGHRAARFREQNPGVILRAPLIERELSKSDCLALVDRAGIELPIMYQLGYRNNNCVGCVKGGMGYWNKIRVDFPEVFDRMAQLERTLGRSVIRADGEQMFLDELDPERGDHVEPDMDCSLTCALAESYL
jgi:hypothetical protein